MGDLAPLLVDAFFLAVFVWLRELLVSFVGARLEIQVLLAAVFVARPAIFVVLRAHLVPVRVQGFLLRVLVEIICV